jgi:hypothetical protein
MSLYHFKRNCRREFSHWDWSGAGLACFRVMGIIATGLAYGQGDIGTPTAWALGCLFGTAWLLTEAQREARRAQRP